MEVDQLVRKAARQVAADPDAAALFECLRPLFLNPDHDVGSMLRACGASRPARDRLNAILGPLKPWVTRLRMTEAARRVRDAQDTDEIIAQALGYSTERGFRRAFQDVHGVTPGEMRRQTRATRPEATTTDRTADDGERSNSASSPRRGSTPRARAFRRRQRLALGLLAPGTAGELRDGLRRRYRLDQNLTGARRDPSAPSGAPAAEIERPEWLALWSRRHRLGLTVKSNLKKPDLGFEPQIDHDLGEGIPAPTAQLAGQLGDELQELSDRVEAHHRERRTVIGLRLRRQLLIQEFDRGTRGIVRIVQGISRLAGREDLGRRFRPILRRTLRQPEEQAPKEGDTPEGGDTSGEGVDASASNVQEATASEEAAP